MGGPNRRRMPFPSRCATDVDRVHRKLQRSAPGRAAERDGVFVTRPGARGSRRLSARLQRRSPAFSPSDGRHLPRTLSHSSRAETWRCAVPRAPRQLPSLPLPNTEVPKARANSKRDKTCGVTP
jgi:hypothetical protein